MPRVLRTSGALRRCVPLFVIGSLVSACGGTDTATSTTASPVTAAPSTAVDSTTMLRPSTTSTTGPPSSTTPTTTTPAELTLTGHQGWVNQAVFSPDGAMIATSGFDGTTRLWKAHTGDTIAVLEAQGFVDNPMEFSPDGTRLLVTGADGSATIWNTMTGRLLVTIPGTPGRMGAATAAFNSDATLVVTASGGARAHVWDAATGALLVEGPAGDGQVQFARWSPDGRMILSNRVGPDVAELWEAASGELMVTLDSGPPGRTMFSPDGKLILTTGVVRVWTLTGILVTSLPEFAVKALFSPEGSGILTVTLGMPGGRAKMWDSTSGALMFTLGSTDSYITAATFSPDGRLIAISSSPDQHRDFVTTLWDARTGDLLTTYSGHTDQVVDASFSPDGTRLVTAGHDGTAKVWLT